MVQVDSTEYEYFSEFKTIRNLLRKYDPRGLVWMCLSYLHQPVTKQMDYIQRYPWCVFLILKWTLLDDQFDDTGRPTPNKEQTLRLLRKVIGLAGNGRMPSKYDHVFLFLRVMSFQQFWYQRRATGLLIGRQLMYFGSLADDNYIGRKFHQETGFKLDRFLQLCQALQSAFGDDNQGRSRIHVSWFRSIQTEYTEEEILKFLRLFSKTIAKIRMSLLKRDTLTRNSGLIPRSASEYYEQSPFINYPLIEDGDYFICVERHLLDRCLAQYVYIRLRDTGAKKFMAYFGTVFEEYVGLAVKHIGLLFCDEKYLQKIFGGVENQKYTDFVISEGDAHIFVDAKAAEMNYHGTVNHKSDKLAGLLESSILHAIKQAISVRDKIREGSFNEQTLLPRSQNYLIVVTYAEMYIGNGRNLADAVGHEVVAALQSGYPEEIRIALEDMYFMTIEEFECLAEAIHAGKFSLVEALERAKVADANPRTRLLKFEQHLVGWGITSPAPAYVIDRTTQALDQLAARIQLDNPGTTYSPG